jgi:hypothetical protein
MDRRQAHIATAGAVLAIAFQVIEECTKQRGVEIGHRQARRRLAQPLLRELQEQPKGIAIAGDGVRAGLALLHEPIHEERLHQRGQCGGGGHGRCSFDRCTRRMT